MSRVFLVTEVELDRKVVVKVLPPEVSAGISGERFKREIQLAARLQHPHIVPLLSAGAKGGLLFYMMPFISGESARARLSRDHELPIAEATRLLRDVVDALAYAHAQGVVHRDIKPDNVLLSGHHAVVTDFGVSKALSHATSSGTLTSFGIALGTPAYMSPEQAAADPNVDHRADIYAVGALAYELLTGGPPFAGMSPQQMMHAHISMNPAPVAERRPSIPAPLAQIVMRCLEKLPADRYQTADELLAELEALATPISGSAPTTPMSAARRRGARRRLAAGVLGVAALASVALWAMRPTRSYLVASNLQVTNAPGLELDGAISPDGRFVAYAMGEPGHTRIFVKQLFGGGSRPLAELVPAGQRYPHWSADGQQISFAVGRALYVAPLLGGTPRTVATLPGEQFLAPVLSPDGSRVAYAVHDSVYVRTLLDGTVHTISGAPYPNSIVWSPSGSRLAFAGDNPQFVSGTSNIGNISPSSIWIADVATGRAIAVVEATALNTSPAWAPDERGIFFVSSRGGGRDIYYQRIGSSGQPRGDAERLTTGANAHTLSVSADGRRLIYTSLVTRSNLWSIPIGGASPGWSGARAITNENQTIEGVGISRDGEWLAYDSNRDGRQHIYKVPASGGDPVPLTRDSADSFLPAWSPSGREITYHAWSNGNRNIFVVSADGSERHQVTSYGGHEMNPVWSPRGDRLLFIADRTNRWELYTVSRTPTGEWSDARQVTHNFGFNGRWSPDGRTIVYLSLEDTTLHAVQDDGTGQRLLFDGHAQGITPNQVAFGPDPSVVYFHAVDSTLRHVFFAMPIAGGKPKPVFRFDDLARQPRRFEFDTDGKRLFVTLASAESDVWMIELTR